MIVDTAEFKCVLTVLEMLSKSNSTYNEMFRKSKFSHTTLQKVLKELTKKELIHKTEENYEINGKGKEMLNRLYSIHDLLK